MKKLTVLDIFLIIFLMSISASAIILMPKTKGTRVVVKVDGDTVYTKSFSKEITTKTIESKYGTNTIEIGDGYVRVISASCPNQLDVKQGSIKNVGESIICLPNHLYITIDGEIDKNYPDVITQWNQEILQL